MINTIGHVFLLALGFTGLLLFLAVFWAAVGYVVYRALARFGVSL